MSFPQTTLRKEMRIARRALTAYQQTQAAQGLLRQVQKHRLYLKSRKVALYLPNDGEIDPTPLLHKALANGKNCYLQVLYRGGTNRLLFGKIPHLQNLKVNRFGIPEPDITKYGWVYANQLDLILAPLVAFDRYGNRIGMGGGYYDRSLQCLKRTQNWQRPHVIGLAHEFQRVESIGRNAWDVPLRGAITDKAIYNFNN